MVQLGELLRELRQKHGLSQEQAASKAQITTRTLRYWENNRRQPRDVELGSLLTALGATPQERGPIYAFLPDTRIVRIAHQVEAANDLPTSALGTMPGLGDLLQAMRLRRGQTQEQVADAMGVTRQTMNRWERTQTLPSDEDIERLCHLLNAAPEERAALQRRRLLPTGWESQLTLEECFQQFAIFGLLNRGEGPLLPLTDLSVLALKRQVRLLLGQSPEALRLLARLEAQHGWWLFMQNRVPEAHAASWRGLTLARERFAPEPFWVHALNLITTHTSPGSERAEYNIALLNSWLPSLPPSLHFWVFCDLALYSGQARRMEAAVHFLKNARQAMEAISQDDGGLSRYYCITYARILLSMGKPCEALDLLPPLESMTMARLSLLLLRAEFCLAAGEKGQATRQLTEAQALLNAIPYPQPQAKWEQLTQRL